MRGPLWNSVRRRITAENADAGFDYTYVFDNSTDEYIDKLTQNSDDDVKRALATVAHAAVMNLLHVLMPTLYSDLEMKCESPIERQMFLGFVLHAIMNNYVVKVPFRRRGEREVSFGPPDVFTPPEGKDYSNGCLVLDPQAMIGNYRVDFSVSLTTEEEVTARDGRLTYVPITRTVLVECDGHDFHERTKEQAAHDRKRDRLLQSVGYRVLRFTGSEIYRDVLGCVDEVMNLFENWPDNIEYSGDTEEE